MSHSSPKSLKYSKNLRLAGIAAGAVILSSGSASAAVSVVNVNFLLNQGTGFVSFNPLSTDFVVSFDSSYSAGVRNCSFNLLTFSDPNFGWSSTILAEGALVDGSLTFTSSGRFEAYPADGAIQFAGYRMINQGTGNDETNYGYVRVTGAPNSTFTFNEYAFETTPGAGIVTTAVPEPGFVMLSAISLGLLFHRKRRT